jgi:hypothetical protein
MEYDDAISGRERRTRGHEAVLHVRALPFNNKLAFCFERDIGPLNECFCALSK